MLKKLGIKEIDFNLFVKLSLYSQEGYRATIRYKIEFFYQSNR